MRDGCGNRGTTTPAKSAFEVSTRLGSTSLRGRHHDRRSERTSRARGRRCSVRAPRYQAGAVVSRTLVKNEGGTVTAFAFDVGEGLSEHTARFDALVVIVDGEAEISVAGKLHRVSSGQLLQLPAGQPHAVKAVGRFKMVLIMIRD